MALTPLNQIRIIRSSPRCGKSFVQLESSMFRNLSLCCWCAPARPPRPGISAGKMPVAGCISDNPPPDAKVRTLRQTPSHRPGWPPTALDKLRRVTPRRIWSSASAAPRPLRPRTRRANSRPPTKSASANAPTTAVSWAASRAASWDAALRRQRRARHPRRRRARAETERTCACRRARLQVGAPAATRRRLPGRSATFLHDLAFSARLRRTSFGSAISGR